jgi:hypothetical protein
MAGIYEEVEIEDMIFDAETMEFTYPCPCGDNFGISLEELDDGEDVADCPSCTLRIRVIFDLEYIEALKEKLGLGEKQEAEAEAAPEVTPVTAEGN